ncbi:hypothetical protein [Pedobacter ginsengisoli]|uniref:hypothetical protein n=1 Tax=Pedobacter ginsengisoli TaxID=363852 RepID=UPI00254B2A94|nr:hypothetical protein [Pedobacter ginsengisoli]
MINDRLCACCNMKIKGRPDKKFCSDQCRSRYNYTYKMSEAKDSFDNIDKILRNNRAILSMLYSKGKKRVNKNFLIAKGFDFEYYTNIRLTEMQNLYFSCYDIGYSIINDLEVLLIKP